MDTQYSDIRFAFGRYLWIVMATKHVHDKNMFVLVVEIVDNYTFEWNC